MQLKRAEVQKKVLLRDIFKQYENYFYMVRKSLHIAVEKGIIKIFSDLSINDKALNIEEFNNFLDKNISLFIHSKLPLITIEQLRLEDISDSQKKFANNGILKELAELKDYHIVNFDYENENENENENELIANESFEFNYNTNQNTYKDYESLSEDKLTSVNLDNISRHNSFSKQIRLKKVENEKHIVDSVLELIEETNDNKLNDYEKINHQVSDFYISSDNLDFFETLNNSFSNFLLNLSYEINSELFKINLIKKIISEETFKCLSDNYHIVKHPYPFIISYDLIPNKVSRNNKFSDIYLLNISNVELEFYNLDLSICRNNINELKNRFRLLNKKYRYWKHKEISINNLN